MKKIFQFVKFGLLACLVFACIPQVVSAEAYQLPYVQIETPQKGQLFKSGDLMPITWNDNVRYFKYTYTYVVIYKLKDTAWDSALENKDVMFLDGDGLDITPNGQGFKDTGEFYWKIPADFVNKPGNYVLKIRISYWDNPNAGANNPPVEGWSSDFFTINQDVNSNTAHPEGINVLGPNGTVYRILKNKRVPYTSAGAFTSYQFNTWSQVQPANNADMSLPFGNYEPGGYNQTLQFIPPRNGSLINDKGTVYLISNGGRAGFTTEAVFKGLGYSYSNVYPGDTSFMTLNYEPINTITQRHSDGVLVNDGGTIYVMQNGSRLAFPNMNMLYSWGYWPNDAVPANGYDRATTVSGIVQPRQVEEMNL